MVQPAATRPIENYEPDDYGPAAAPVAAPRNGTTNGTRVPPHDLDAERAVISACLYADTETVAQVAHLEPADFYSTRHQTIWTAVLDLHAQGVAPDPHLLGVERELAFELGGNQLAYRSNVATYAQVISTHAWRRKVIGLAADLADRAYTTDEIDIVGMATRVERPIITEEEPLTTDLNEIAAGHVERVVPTIGERGDGRTCFLYRPGINWFSSEPGYGKSNFGMWWCAKEMQAGNRVTYFDFETTEYGVQDRMSQMGVTDFSLMSYIRRSGPWTHQLLDQARALLRAEQPTLVVFDAVAGAMEAEGLDPESNGDVERWAAGLPMFATSVNAAVLCLDHLTKSKDSRGRYPIGAQRKLARADAAYVLEMDDEAGVGKIGRGRLLLMKDRWGAVSQYAVGKEVAYVMVESETVSDCEHELSISLVAPRGDINGTPPGERGEVWDQYRYRRGVCETLRDHGGTLSAGDLRAFLKKSSDGIAKALTWLEKNHYVTREGPRRPWRLVRMYDIPVEVEVPPPPTIDDEVF